MTKNRFLDLDIVNDLLDGYSYLLVLISQDCIYMRYLKTHPIHFS